MGNVIHGCYTPYFFSQLCNFGIRFKIWYHLVHSGPYSKIFFNSGLTCELYNLFDDWWESTNQLPSGLHNLWVNPGVKNLMNKAHNIPTFKSYFKIIRKNNPRNRMLLFPISAYREKFNLFFLSQSLVFFEGLILNSPFTKTFL